MEKSIKLITHNGSFHTDDIFASAAFCILFEKRKEDFEIIRTRDEEMISSGDIVFDVGGIYDRNSNRFDHHQIGGAGTRQNGIEYASFGLVWEKFGEEICGSKKVADLIDKRLGGPIDAWDNGIDLVKSTHEAAPYFLQYIFFAMHPTWREEEVDIDKIFGRAVDMATEILRREIIQAQDMVLAEEEVQAIYDRTLDKRVIVFDKNYPFEYILLKYPEPKFAVYPRKTGGSFGVKAIRIDMNSFETRKKFPESWYGKKDKELQKITEVEDAVFCHRAGYLCTAETKEGAIKLAKLALEL